VAAPCRLNDGWCDREKPIRALRAVDPASV
jgi:hypothetical protein